MILDKSTNIVKLLPYVNYENVSLLVSDLYWYDFQSIVIVHRFVSPLFNYFSTLRQIKRIAFDSLFVLYEEKNRTLRGEKHADKALFMTLLLHCL